MGNLFSYIMLVMWPLIAIYLYQTQKIQLATIWTIMGGFMFLPVQTSINFPMVPEMGKQTVPAVSALIGCWLIKKQHISYFKELGKIRYLVALFLIVPFITAGLNSDAVIVGQRYLPGLSSYDGLSAMVNQFLIVTPFFIGRQLFKTYDDQLLMFRLLVVMGLFYSVLMLFEIRMSPQLHTWLYGYFPHSFAQQVRLEGYRPVVFMGHGLLVAFFAMTITLAATALWKNGDRIRKLSPALVSYYLLGVLVLCKSMASLIYGLYAYILIRHTSTKTQFRLAILLVILALLYPTMSILKAFPHQEIIKLAGVVDEDRAGSLKFRFNQEAALLDRGAERFFFGWGGWGRNRVFNDETGKDESVTDGRWIITFGQFGWFGFMTEFGLLALTVFRAYKASKIVKNRKELNLLAAHAILVSLIMIDQLPNASLAPWLWLIAGVLLGRSEEIIKNDKSSKKELLSEGN